MVYNYNAQVHTTHGPGEWTSGPEWNDHRSCTAWLDALEVVLNVGQPQYAGASRKNLNMILILGLHFIDARVVCVKTLKSTLKSSSNPRLVTRRTPRWPACGSLRRRCFLGHESLPVPVLVAGGLIGACRPWWLLAALRLPMA